MKSNNDVKRFTVLGLTGSGKTCLLLGMCDSIRGIQGYTLSTDDENSARINRNIDKLHYGRGMDRFPSGTSVDDFEKYAFTLWHGADIVSQFEWVDYGGGILESSASENPKVNDVYDSIDRSSVLYLCMDGALFNHERIEDVLTSTAKTARVLNRFITRYYESHMRSVPPIVLVITKLDICCETISDDVIEEVIRQHFSSLLNIPGLRLYITATTLGPHIADDDYSGPFEPEKMEIPYMLGVYHLLELQNKYTAKEIAQDIGVGFAFPPAALVLTLVQKGKHKEMNEHQYDMRRDVGNLIDQLGKDQDDSSIIVFSDGDKKQHFHFHQDSQA